MRVLAFPITTIDPIDELVEELIHVFSADTVKSAQQEAIRIGSHDVYHGQPFASLLRRCDFGQVLTMATFGRFRPPRSPYSAEKSRQGCALLRGVTAMLIRNITPETK